MSRALLLFLVVVALAVTVPQAATAGFSGGGDGPAPTYIEPDPGDLEPCAWWQNYSTRTIPWGFYPWVAEQQCLWSTAMGGFRWHIVRIYVRW